MTKLQALSNAIIKAAKPGGPRQLTDGQGLFLELSWDAKGNPNHAWRFTYVSPVTGQRGNKLTFGRWPLTTIAMAREKAHEARSLIAQGIDPMQAKREAEAKQAQLQAIKELVAKGDALPGTFRFMAEKCVRHHMEVLRDWSDVHRGQFERTCKKYIFPKIGDMQCADIRPKHITDIIDPCDAKRMFATSRNIRRFCYQVLARAVHEELCEWNAAANIKEMVMTQKHVKNRPAFTTAPKVRELLLAIKGYTHDTKRRALMTFVYTWQRKVNICRMRWADVNLDAGIWTIPSEEMKGSREKKENGEDHICVLSRQAVEVLREQFAETGSLEWVFPAVFDNTKPLPDTAMNESLYLLGFEKGTHTPHGFRAMGRTLAREELGIDKDVLEAQLAHVTDEELGTAYAREKWFKQRAEAMQKWADYLDQLIDAPVAQLALAA